MKAAVYHGVRDIRIEQVPAPHQCSGNMVARVISCAICGTDLKTYNIGNPKFKPPVILGHELVGELVHVGENVTGFALGDRVTLATTVPCGACAYCKRGLGNVCLDAKPVSSYYSGAFAEFIEIPQQAIEMGCVIKLPAAGDCRHYSLCEPLSCAVNAQDILGVGSGDTVLIIGGGPLGVIHAELAKARGAKQVFISDVSEKRIRLMSRLRDITLINGAASDVGAVIKDATGGLGADAVIVCAPAAKAFEESVSYVRKGGGVSFFASLPPGSELLSLNSRTIHYNELRVTGASDSRSEHVRRAAALITEGRIDCGAIITHEVPLERITDGFALMAEQESLKVLVRPWEVQA